MCLTDRGFEQLLYLLGKAVSNISFECAFCQSKKNAVPKQKQRRKQRKRVLKPLIMAS